MSQVSAETLAMPLSYLKFLQFFERIALKDRIPNALGRRGVDTFTLNTLKESHIWEILKLILKG
jgi:hypothetical protein